MKTLWGCHWYHLACILMDKCKKAVTQIFLALIHRYRITVPNQIRHHRGTDLSNDTTIKLCIENELQEYTKCFSHMWGHYVCYSKACLADPWIHWNDKKKCVDALMRVKTLQCHEKKFLHHNMFCFNHVSVFYTSNNIVNRCWWIRNNRLEC